MYNSTKWQDRIIDKNTGAVYQHGTPMSAANFNNMEQGIHTSMAGMLNNKEALKAMAHSGILKWQEPDLTNTETNCFYTGKEEITALVNGEIIKIQRTKIQLPEPPVEDFINIKGRKGEREDLVFLETWKEKEGNEVVNKWRIRVVDDIDFDEYTEDGFYKGVGTSWSYVNRKIRAQGGNENLIEINNITHISRCGSFIPTSQRTSFNSNFKNNDSGLYITGDGTEASKTVLKTHDGYVYAIPLFRVKRRNSGAYSENNPNGARETYIPEILSIKAVDGRTVKCTITKGSTYSFDLNMDDETYDNIKIGDKWTNSVGNAYLTVLEKINKNTKTIKLYRNHGDFIVNSYPFRLSGLTQSIAIDDRPDKQYANIISERDIIDLRHKVSLTGYNYQQLLEENFDKLLRGELQTKEKTKIKKTYHGIKKTPIDSNVIYYNSFDTEKGEVNHKANGRLTRGIPSPTGLSAKHSGSHVEFTTPINETAMTIDFWYFPLEFYNGGYHLSVEYEDGTKSYMISHNKHIIQNLHLNEWSHVRVAINLTMKEYSVYVNGKKIAGTHALFDNFNNVGSLSKISLGCTSINDKGYFSDSYDNPGYISDLSISNIDRGSDFATLPKDFIEGHADITNAFNEQRECFADSLTSQITRDIISVKKGLNKKHIEITQATEGNWASGDTIKIKGLTGEVLSGIIDTDTALSKVVEFIDSYRIRVDNIDKLTVDDSFIALPNKTVLNEPIIRTITHIDTETKIITFKDKATIAAIEGYRLFEITENSSSPTIKYKNNTEIKNIAGTWSGLGTNEITFTFGTNVELDNANIEVGYSCHYQSGQGQIPVYSDILQGEYNNHKLVKSDSIKITDDFKGKVSTSFSECPHRSLHGKAKELKKPMDEIRYEGQEKYNQISELDGELCLETAVNNGDIPQQIFSFNLVKMVKEKFGEIPAIDEVKWIKENIKTVRVHWSGQGRSPENTNGYFQAYALDLQKWTLKVTNENNFVEKKSLALNVQDTPNRWIDANGDVYYLAHTDPSNGTKEAIIYTDYISIEIELKSDSTYTILAPENTRRDAGKSGVILVRPETKEVKRYPLGEADNNTGIKIWGDYVPQQLSRYIKDKSVVYKRPKLTILNHGSGFYANYKKYSNAVNKLIDNLDVSGEKLKSSSEYNYKTMESDLIGLNLYNCGILEKELSGYHEENGLMYSGTDFLKKLKGIVLGCAPSLVNIDNQLYLSVLLRDNSHSNIKGKTGMGAGLNSYVVPLHGRPLIKEAF